MIVGRGPFRFSASSYASAPIRTMMLAALLPPTQAHILLLTMKANTAIHLGFVHVGQMCEFCPHLVGDGFIDRCELERLLFKQVVCD